MIIRSPNQVIYIPLVPFLCLFFGVYFYMGMIVANPDLLPTLLAIRIGASLFIASILSLFLFAVLTQEGKDLIIRKLLYKRTVSIPNSHLCVRRRILCIEDQSKNLVVFLMPYPYERTRGIVHTLNAKFSIKSISEGELISSEQNVRKQDIFVGIWAISGGIVILIVVYLLMGDGQFHEYLDLGWVKDITIGIWEALKESK